MKRITVLIDSREQKPLRFPSNLKWYPNRGGKSEIVRVRTSKVALPTGDYTLEGFDQRVLVERKGSLDELAQNLLSDDYTRAMASFTRLSKRASVCYLLVECKASELKKATRWTQEPERVVDALAALLARLKLRLILCGECRTAVQKRTMGEILLRIMLAECFPLSPDYSGVDGVIQQIGKTK